MFNKGRQLPTPPRFRQNSRRNSKEKKWTEKAKKKKKNNNNNNNNNLFCFGLVWFHLWHIVV